MSVISPDKARPSVTEAPATTEALATLTTNQSMHTEMVNGIVAAVKPTIPSFTHEQARPPAVHPVPASPELAQVGAERVGSEELTVQENAQSEIRDWKHRLSRWYHKIFGGLTEKRWGPLGKIASRIRSIRVKENTAEIVKGVTTEEIQ